MIAGIDCPKCKSPLEANLNEYESQDHDYVEVKFTCKNKHEFFVWVKEEDLVEVL